MIFRPGVTGQRNTKHFRVIESDDIRGSTPSPFYNFLFVNLR